jgi:hypothetical protein
MNLETCKTGQPHPAGSQPPPPGRHDATDTTPTAPTRARAGRRPRPPGRPGPPQPAAINRATGPYHPGAHPDPAHPGSPWLAQAHRLLTDAYQTITDADGDGDAAGRRPGRQHQARLAASLAEFTGWAELAISPGNLPPAGSTGLTGPDRSGLSARMEHAAGRLHQARWQLETLAATDGPPAPAPAVDPVLGPVADAARHAEHAWMLIQQTRGYTHRRQVVEVATELGDLTAVLGQLARHLHDTESADQQNGRPPETPAGRHPGGSWREAVVRLGHAHHAVVACTPTAATAPGGSPPAPTPPEDQPPGTRAGTPEPPGNRDDDG